MHKSLRDDHYVFKVVVHDVFDSFSFWKYNSGRDRFKKFSMMNSCITLNYTLLCCNLVEDISHTSWLPLLRWLEVLSLLTLLVVFRRVLDTLRQHFLTMTIQATSRSSQHVNRLAPINRLNVPPTSHSKSMVPYPTSSLMYSNSRFWKRKLSQTLLICFPIHITIVSLHNYIVYLIKNRGAGAKKLRQQSNIVNGIFSRNSFKRKFPIAA